MRRLIVLACAAAGLAALFAAPVLPMAVQGRGFVVYNPTDSVRRGWYFVERANDTAALQTGSTVLAWLTPDVASFAAQRGYLPKDVPILKHVGAVSPQTVCVQRQHVFVDGELVAVVLSVDSAQRQLQAWTQCRVLADDELFLLSETNPASFDSRYFGPISTAAVLGIAHPLWTWDAR